MALTEGRREVAVALIDGPVALDHPELIDSSIEEIPTRVRGACSHVRSAACMHGTFVAGVLAARRGSQAPAICPGSTLMLRPIFSENRDATDDVPRATPDDLATAIIDAISASANIINLSAALVQPSSRGERQVSQAL